MRATLTIDDDVAAALGRLRRNATSLKDLVNETLRRGLRDMGSPATQRKRHRTASVDLGTARIANIGNISEVLAAIENLPSS